MVCTTDLPAPLETETSVVASNVSLMRPACALQPSFDDLGRSLADVTFCVVDLETTGGGRDSSITEIGAVKVTGGEIVGEFQSLVRPEGEIPALIQVLTGITTQMVADAPVISQVLPPFIEFAKGCVLVAHNASFDVGFLRRAHEALGMTWFRPEVVDTVKLARSTLLPDEVRNCKLSTLAAYFNATTTPDHRALSDARATVDVLHALLERAGSLGVHTLEDLRDFTSQVSPDRRAKRVWARDAPSGPGVYWFIHQGRDVDGTRRDEVLYVGRSRDLKKRVRSYFSAAERRSRIHEMVRIATGVRFLRCSSDLESRVRELRMIASLAPRYNRRSRNQQGVVWLRLTNEPFPRLSVVRKVVAEAAHWGPFSSAKAAQEAALALQEAFGIRGCKRRLSPTKPSPACALAEMGQCAAPCQLGPGVAQYHQSVTELLRVWAGDAAPMLVSARSRLARLVPEERFEEAGQVISNLLAFYRTSVRHHRVRSLAGCSQIVAAAPEDDGWAVHVIRHGKLAAAAHTTRNEVPRVAGTLPDAAETVLMPSGGVPAGTLEEAECVAAWLETPGVRLLAVEGEWSLPVRAGIKQEDLADALWESKSLSDLAFGASDQASLPDVEVRLASGLLS